MNNDGAGYNSTEHIAVMGWGRTNGDSAIEEAARTFGLQVLANPMPRQNLYERSDNISFARAGIPAVNFSPGVSEMDEEVAKYYHKAADNPETVDFDYLLLLCKSYALAARSLANHKGALSWTPGDIFERK